MSVFTPHTPVFDRLLELQQADEAAVTHESLERIARRVIKLAAALENPVIVPVDDSAQRVLGVITLISLGKVEAITWTSQVTNRDVLLVGTVAATTIEFETVAGVLRSRGASYIHACALHIDSLGTLRKIDALDLIDPQVQDHLKAV